MKTPKSPHSTVTMLTSDIKCVIAFFSKRHDLGEKLRLKLRTLSVYCSEALAGNIVDIFLAVEFCNILSHFFAVPIFLYPYLPLILGHFLTYSFDHQCMKPLLY